MGVIDLYFDVFGLGGHSIDQVIAEFSGMSEHEQDRVEMKVFFEQLWEKFKELAELHEEQSRIDKEIADELRRIYREVCSYTNRY